MLLASAVMPGVSFLQDALEGPAVIIKQFEHKVRVAMLLQTNRKSAAAEVAARICCPHVLADLLTIDSEFVCFLQLFLSVEVPCRSQA